MSETNTPIRQQYLDIKKQYPDAILFFRLGDFYETFDEDAVITARELDLSLRQEALARKSAHRWRESHTTRSRIILPA